MTKIVSVEFLKDNGFSLEEFSDGNFWVRRYTGWYILQADDETLSKFVEYDNNFIEQLTPEEFIDTIATHNQAINR